MENVAETGWNSTLTFLGNLWALQIFTVDGQPLTVGKVIAGLLLLIVAYWVSRRATNSFDRKFLSEVDPSMRHMLRRAVFAGLLFIAILFILRILNVPITIFTVLGGALAIGVGFGSQNVVNNFISGLIMMIEQPIRVGDFVEVDEVKGTIEAIGTRATIMRSPENKRIILPNSYFLEKSLTNWNLGDTIIRGKVMVGVAYGSDLQLVKNLLYKAALDQPATLRSPEPLILFSDFGDSSLNFTVYIWTNVNLNTVMQVESDVRFAIDKLFRENNISIPFPQRDVHLELKQPVNVQMAKPT